MSRSRTAGLSLALATVLLTASGFWIDAAQDPPVAAPPVPQTAGGSPAAPAQFPPLGTSASAEERVSLQAAVDRLGAKIAILKKQYPARPMVDRIADVEVYLDAVRRPLKYDE